MPYHKNSTICPICKQGKRFKFVRDFSADTDNYSLYQCLECQVQFWLPLKVIGHNWYENNNPYQIRDLVKIKISREYHKDFLKRHKFFSHDPGGAPKILDLGCGSGEFIAELKKRGCEVWGVDFDRNAIGIAKKRFGLENVYAMPFEEFFKKQDLPKFDVITFFEVIEHLEDPLVFIQNVEKLLKPGGKLALSTPIRGRMLANLNSWDFPPHHFSRWNEKAIANIFKKHDFHISRVDYVEQFKILSESVSGKLGTGLVDKSLKVLGSKKGFIIFPKIVYFLGRLKQLFLGKVPAIFLWIFAKITNRKNGIMLIELTQTKKKKIIFLLPTLSDGGGERVVSELTRALPTDIENIVVLFEEKIGYPYRGRIISLRVPLSLNHLYRSYAFFVRLTRFKKIIRAEKPDYVISLGASANIINILTNKNSIVRVDMFLSKEHRGFGRFLFKILIKICFNRSRKIITVSKAAAGDLVDNFGVKKEKIITIYNPINVEKIQKLAKEDLEPQYREIFKNPVLISAGRMTKQKGQWHLIRAFSEAKKEIKNLKLVIMGDGELKPYLKELIDSYNLKEEIFLLGWQKNPFKFIAKSELFVLPSLWEGLPMVLIETMACGVPIISSDFKSGARELLAPETDFNFETDKIEYAKYGVLVPVFDDNFYKAEQPLAKEEEILSEAIIEVSRNEKTKKNLSAGLSGRAREFDIKNIIKEWSFL